MALVSLARLCHDRNRGKILLRVFCHAHGDRIILLLGGYDKGERPAPRQQQEQIAVARLRLKAWKARHRADQPRKK